MLYQPAEGCRNYLYGNGQYFRSIGWAYPIVARPLIMKLNFVSSLHNIFIFNLHNGYY